MPDPLFTEGFPDPVFAEGLPNPILTEGFPNASDNPFFPNRFTKEITNSWERFFSCPVPSLDNCFFGFCRYFFNSLGDVIDLILCPVNGILCCTAYRSHQALGCICNGGRCFLRSVNNSIFHSGRYIFSGRGNFLCRVRNCFCNFLGGILNIVETITDPRVSINIGAVNRIVITVREEVKSNGAIGCSQIFDIIGVQESTCCRIVVTGLQVVIPGFDITVVSAISKGVDRCNFAFARCKDTSTPSIISITCYCISGFVYDCDNIILKVSMEIVGNIVVNNTTNNIFVVVKRYQDIVIPFFTNDFCSFKEETVENTVNVFRYTHTVGVVGINVIVNTLKLTSLFPSQGMAKILNGVALRIIFYCCLTIVRGKKVFPSIIAICVTDLGCFYDLARLINDSFFKDVAVGIINKLSGYAIDCFGLEQIERIIGVINNSEDTVINVNDAIFSIILVRNRSFIGEDDLAYQLSGSG